MHRKQHVEGLCRTALEEVAAEGDLPDAALCTQLQRFGPVALEGCDILPGYVHVVHQKQARCLILIHDR